MALRDSTADHQSLMNELARVNGLLHQSRVDHEALRSERDELMELIVQGRAGQVHHLFWRSDSETIS